MVGLHLQHEVHYRGTTINPQITNRHTRRAGHGVDHVAGLHHHALDGGTCDVRTSGATGDTENGAARIRVPPGAAEPDECWDEHDSAGIGHAFCERTNFTRGINDVEAVAQPLHGSPGHKDCTLECIDRWLRIELPCHRGEHALGRRRTRRADIQQHETAGAIGVLGAARCETRLAKERRLLIAGNATHGHTSGNRAVGNRRTDATARGANLGQLVFVDAEQRARVIAPAQRANIEQHRARCIGHVGREGSTTRESVHEKCIDRGERKVLVACNFGVAQQPLDL